MSNCCYALQLEFRNSGNQGGKLRRTFRIFRDRRIALLVCGLMIVANSSPSNAAEEIGPVTAYDAVSNSPVGTSVTYWGPLMESVGFFGQKVVRGTADSWIAELPHCDEKHKIYCVASLEARSSSSSAFEAGQISAWKPTSNDPMLDIETYTSNGVLKNAEFEVSPTSREITGGRAEVWDFPNTTHLGGSQYLLAAGLRTNTSNTPGVLPFSLDINLTPVFLADRLKAVDNTKWPRYPVDYYGQEFHFEENSEFRLTLKLGDLTSKVGNWLNSTFSDGTIDVGIDSLVITGKHSKKLIAISSPMKCKELPDLASFEKVACDNGAFEGSRGLRGITEQHERLNLTSSSYPQGAFAFWESKLKPIGYKTKWAVRTIPAPYNSSGCRVETKEMAMVGTNATAWSHWGPRWNQDSRALEYGAASLHLDGDGAVQTGVYFADLPNNFAKCSWGFTPSQSLAVSSIIDENGNSQTGIISLIARSSMTKFRVSGFHYSSNRVAISMVPKPIKKITCVKNKSRKIISGVAPKCPKGFKLSK
jgi:hypothetical protein